MSLLVCSNSTKDFLQGFDKKKIISSAPDKSILDEMGSEESVIAIGGGAVIDTAKIICKNSIICTPLLHQVHQKHLGLYIGMEVIK